MTRKELEDKLMEIARKEMQRICYEPEFLRKMMETAKRIANGETEGVLDWYT